MKLRSLGALLGAAVLTFGVASSVFAAKPTYQISVSKVADPTTLQAPIAAGTMVTYWFTVTNTGTHAFHDAGVTDDPGCSISFVTSSDGSMPGANGKDGMLAAGQWWKFMCQVDASGWSVGTHTDTATATACGDSSIKSCNQSAHFDSATDTATVTVLAAGKVAPPTAPATSTVAPSSSNGSSLPWLAVVFVLASVMSLALMSHRRRNRI
jgi:uncharacterized repeat protein (TIGR01451 family)